METSVQRQIEFTGDSLTVGYGNLSASRTCTWDQLRRNANSDMTTAPSPFGN
ncbi:hypothetical protein [Streptomyces bobili]|uniref:hypothetical protein n=1 Tax=Streptomyces bobili TaxID=67280 RepID=UPI003798B734